MPELDYFEIGSNIRIQRILNGLKQKDLAERVNVSPQHISHVETGRAKPSLLTLVDIANALNIDMNMLLGKNLTSSRHTVLNAQIAQVLEGADDELLERILLFCREEVQFYKNQKNCQIN